MDKLEKAMEKARMQRAATTGQPIGTTAPFAPVSGAPVPRAASYKPHDNTQVINLSDALLERARIVAHLSRSKEADIYRLLRTQVLQTMQREGMRSLAITSPNYGDGKTTTALNLAISIAQDLKQTVLLVDLDLRKPNVHAFLGIEPLKGLSDYLMRGTPIPECLIRLSFDRLSLLPAGAPVEQSSEALGLPRMAALAHELKTRYPDRLIIYDMPPVLEQDDPLAFIPQVDGVLLVLREGKTKTTDTTRCLEVLAAAKIVGTVLNEVS